MSSHASSTPTTPSARTAPESDGIRSPSPVNSRPKTLDDRQVLEQRLAAQKLALELAVNGESIDVILNHIVRATQEQGGEQARAALFIVDPEGARLRFGAAAGLSEEYTRAVDGVGIKPTNLSCGRAAYTGTAVIVRDVATDPLWAPFIALAQQHDIRACWSFPITFGQTVLGTLAVYHRQPQEPDADHVESVRLLAQTAAQVLAHHRASQDCQDALTKLKSAHELLADKAAHLEAVVAERTAKLHAVVEDLEAFSYSIAHDLRAPLRSMRGFSEVLMEDHAAGLNPEGLSHLKRIAGAADRMDRLVMDVLEYSRVVRADLPVGQVCLDELVRGIVACDRRLAEQMPDLIAGPLPRVSGNPALLTQVFSNLFDNALKFVAAGTKPRVQIWAERNAPKVRVLVRDNGIGIPPEHHERIFGIFQRLDPTTRGTGIGLAIVKKALERMDGSVGLFSVPGEGTTFWVDLNAA